MKRRDLKKASNRILCELEDHLLDALIDNMDDMQSSDPATSGSALLSITKDMSMAVKDNAESITLICYVKDDGTDLTVKDLVDEDGNNLPLKLMVFTECFSDIMEIVLEFMNGESNKTEPGKQKRVTSTRGPSKDD